MEENINALLIDFDASPDWKFFDGLNHSAKNWIIEKKESNWSQKKKINNFKRYYTYFVFSISKFFQIKKYKKIVAWQQFYGLFLCFFIKILRKKSDVQIILLTFIYKEKKGIIGKLYKFFIKTSLKCKNLKKVVVLSKYEIDYYAKKLGIPKDKFEFLKIGISKMPKFKIVKGDYFLSVGRSNRDYDFLVNSFRNSAYKLIILSDTYKNNDLPKNIIINDNCFDDDFEKLLAQSFAIVISLNDEPISSGQLVVNYAYVYHKPVIVTNNPGIIDYVDDKVNGYVIEKKEKELFDAINQLKNEDTYTYISNNNKCSNEFDYGKNVEKLFS